MIPYFHIRIQRHKLLCPAYDFHYAYLLGYHLHSVIVFYFGKIGAFYISWQRYLHIDICVFKHLWCKIICFWNIIIIKYPFKLLRKFGIFFLNIRPILWNWFGSFVSTVVRLYLSVNFCIKLHKGLFYFISR